MLEPKVPVAREGYPFIGLGVFVTIFMALVGWPIIAWICFFLTLFTLSFFRDPERFVPHEEGALVSPADGKVIMAEKVVNNPFTDGEAYKVAIFMNVFNVHVNRIPMSGRVERIIHRPGRFYSADTDKAELHNESCATILTTPAGHTIGCVQIAGLIARRIVCWLEPGDMAVKGRRYGLIRFGSRVDLYLPPTSTLLVEKGRKVRAGETVIATVPVSEE